MGVCCESAADPKGSQINITMVSSKPEPQICKLNEQLTPSLFNNQFNNKEQNLYPSLIANQQIKYYPDIDPIQNAFKDVYNHKIGSQQFYNLPYGEFKKNPNKFSHQDIQLQNQNQKININPENNRDEYQQIRFSQLAKSYPKGYIQIKTRKRY